MVGASRPSTSKTATTATAKADAQHSHLNVQVARPLVINSTFSFGNRYYSGADGFGRGCCCCHPDRIAASCVAPVEQPQGAAPFAVARLDHGAAALVCS